MHFNWCDTGQLNISKQMSTSASYPSLANHEILGKLQGNLEITFLMLPNNKDRFNWEHLLIMTSKESSTPEKSSEKAQESLWYSIHNKYMHLKAYKGYKF